MRVALAVEGTRGDVHPLLALAEGLRGRGHDVVLCAPPDFRAESQARGIEFHPVGIPVRDYLGANARALVGGAWAMAREAERYLAASLPRQFQALPEAVAGSDLLVAAGTQGAAASVAEHLGIAYRYVAYCPALLPSSTYGPAMLPFQGWPPWANRWLWRGLLGVYGRRFRSWLAPLRGALGLPPVRDAYHHLLGERPLLAADPELAPLPPDCPLEVERIPCLHPVDGEPLPEKLEAFLSAGPPPVYLGFGSMPDPRPGATTRALLAALSRLGCRALISRGWAGLGGEPLPAEVFELETVCHARLFPRCALVVHHGGAGTTTNAARAGVAQLVVPHVMDQFYWAARVEALGVAPPALPRRRLNAARLAERIAAGLDAEWLGERARELAAALREGRARAPDPAEVVTARA